MQGEIVGRPTLLATYKERRDAEEILNRLRGLGYPLDDVQIFYRPEGTEEVIDAITGQVAAGQSLTEEELTRKKVEKVDTLVLLHPEADRFEAVRQALVDLGNADIKYSNETYAAGRGGRTERHDAPPPPATT